jgi:hypothetical protein
MGLCLDRLKGGVQRCRGTFGLGPERRPVGHIGVPFDERRARAAAGDRVGIERPDGIHDLAAMAVDQERLTVVIFVLIMAAEVDFANGIERKASI